MLIADILHRAARPHPERRAAWFEGAWRTYGELSAAALRFASFLRVEGVVPRERVALLLDNSVDRSIAHFGALTAGAVEVSLNTDLKASDLGKLLNDCEAVALVVGKRHLWSCCGILGDVSPFAVFRLKQITKQWNGLQTRLAARTRAYQAVS